MTYNVNNNDYAMGDRLLAIWQALGNYYFSTLHDGTGANDYDRAKEVTHPTDIEGLWTFIYFSHGKSAQRSVGFTKFGLTANPSRF